MCYRVSVAPEEGVQLQKEILFHGIRHFYITPTEAGQMEFVFQDLSDYQLKLLTYVLRKYQISVTIQ
ncbi:hypothetical protein [Brevibacillus fulvus]|uniref:Uncharacterized protein n=1 Tax=Brevibacillus fulvus TaxID=1125967 RepID=A0A938XZQ7_9BACL|nr:hypothetical protein [Brevibacillus fulvus]MBM7590660.1 hypothetical protein [Brevibacillus fulvus]